MSRRDGTWALNLFRPLLKDLKIPDLDTSRMVLPSEYLACIRHHMENCAIVVYRYTFTNPEYKGVFVWQYDNTEKFHVLYIILNDNLFESKEHEKRVIRKAVSTHEFVHCVAAMVTISSLETERLIKAVYEKMSRQIEALTENDVRLFLKQSTSDAQSIGEYENIFDDNHFRTGYEDFTGDYLLLYRDLLFSYQLFCEEEFCGKKIRAELTDAIGKKDREKSISILQSILKKLSREKALDANFVITRFIDSFLPELLKEFKDNTRNY